jgi:hypothetical protein
MTRAFLAICRQLPWRTMTFLRDCHHLGILRQVGGVYQFRHALIQQHLSTVPPSSPDPAQDPPEVVVTTHAPSLASRIPLYLVQWIMAALSASLVSPKPQDTSEDWIMTGAGLIAPVVAGILFLLPVIDELRLGRGRRNKQTLRMNEEVIELSGPVALTVPWQDITRIGVRKLGGQAGKTYGVQRQLAPEQKQPEIETQDGWITIWNLGPSPNPPAELSNALRRFGGTRWSV